MNFRVFVVALVAVIASHCQALSWGWQGHQTVGSIADQLLKKNAKKKVDDHLGFSLRVAAPWADCVRSVKRLKDHTTFKYTPNSRYDAPCPSFATGEEKARMEDYVARNWTKCTYQNGNAGCEDTYHFADVSIDHDQYDRKYKGTGERDIVSVINAAIGVLKGKKSPDEISIRDEKEALFLLAHLVGDLHQPLHVGAVYLDGDGDTVDPDKGAYDKATETHGGNSILKDVDEDCKGSNLHSEWDGIPKSLAPLAKKGLIKPAGKTLVDEARDVEDTDGEVETFAKKWATDSVRQAKLAFKGLTFSGTKCDGKWLVNFDDRKKYLAAQNKLKREQLSKAGAKLAQLLNAIWP